MCTSPVCNQLDLDNRKENNPNGSTRKEYFNASWRRQARNLTVEASDLPHACSVLNLIFMIDGQGYFFLCGL